MTKHDISHFHQILLIDTTNRDQTRLALITGDKAERVEQESRAQELQAMIDALLTSHHLHPTDINVIAVLTGPASFTGARIGITCANTLAWLNKTLLIPLPGTDFDTAIEDLVSRQQFELVPKIEPTA
jgi:tRNA A37 threonylcarbamoyladenosine modification protein TsaB